MNKRSLALVAKSSVVYAIAYLLAGGLAYKLITKRFYVGENPLFTAYLRSESNATEWAHTNIWLVPGLLLRATLISLVLLPFVAVLEELVFLKRVGVVFALMFVLTHFAAAAPSPSNVEGIVDMKPQLVTAASFLLTQPEMILQCLLFAVGLSWLIKRPGRKVNGGSEALAASGSAT